MYGVEFPERPLMAVLSDLLGIPHFTTSRGATVRTDFLMSVASALSLDGAVPPGRKDDVLRFCVEQATHRPMDPSLLSPGATVTNEALQAIIDGVMWNGVHGRPALPVAPREEVAEEELFEVPDFDVLRDERDKRLLEIAVREGQDQFRLALLEAYDHRCAVTGFDAVESLDAAHIYPYRGPASNHVTNGLVLRADIHRLFDRGAFTFDELKHLVLIKPHLLVTQYADLAGRKLRLPRKLHLRPSTAALRDHREWAGL
jgi:hypothetical protein